MISVVLLSHRLASSCAGPVVAEDASCDGEETAGCTVDCDAATGVGVDVGVGVGVGSADVVDGVTGVEVEVKVKVGVVVGRTRLEWDSVGLRQS